MVSLSDDGLECEADPETDETADPVPREIEIMLRCLPIESEG